MLPRRVSLSAEVCDYQAPMERHNSFQVRDVYKESREYTASRWLLLHFSKILCNSTVTYIIAFRTRESVLYFKFDVPESLLGRCIDATGALHVLMIEAR